MKMKFLHGFNFYRWDEEMEFVLHMTISLTISEDRLFTVWKYIIKWERGVEDFENKAIIRSVNYAEQNLYSTSAVMS